MSASLVITGAFILVILAGVRPRFRSGRVPILVGILVPMALWVAIVNYLFPLPHSYPDTPADELVAQGIRKLDPQALARAHYLFIIEGSSVTMNGLDGALVESRLSEKGIPAIVVQLSAPGANQAERYEFLREFVDALSPEQFQRLHHLTVVLCREVELGYDKNPFNNLLRNGSTGRSLRYLLPLNFTTFSRWLVLKFGPARWLREHNTLAEFLGCELFNAFHIGYLLRVEDLPPPNKAEPFLPYDNQRPGFAPAGPLYPPSDLVLDKGLVAQFKENIPWQRQRDADFQKVFRGLVKTQCYFAFPTWFKPNSAYNLWKHRTTKDHLFFDGEQTPLVDQLNDPALWYDELHLQRSGAKIYSEAFADYLMQRVQAGEF
jgi:hypothetical protein